jgi:hypothetical protein
MKIRTDGSIDWCCDDAKSSQFFQPMWERGKITGFVLKDGSSDEEVKYCPFCGVEIIREEVAAGSAT